MALPRFILRPLPARIAYFACMLAIVTLSVVPGSGKSLWHWDKVGHFAAYAFLGLLGWLAFQGKSARAIGIVWGFMLGILLEWVQSYVPAREPSILDIAANTVGIAAGLASGILLAGKTAQNAIEI